MIYDMFSAKVVFSRKMNPMQAALFLIPVTLGETEHRRVLPEYNRDIVLGIRHFIVENVRTARRFLKRVDRSIEIDDLTFAELNKHTSPEAVAGYLEPLARGESVGGSGRGGDRPAERLSGSSVGWTLFYLIGSDGLGIQWAEFRFSWLSPDRGSRANERDQAPGGKDLFRAPDATFHRDTLSQQQAG